MVRSWKVLEDSDDDVAAPFNAVGAAGAQAEKKKRKKAKKKNPAAAASSESTTVLSSFGGALEHVLAKAVESGFTKAAAEAAIEAMWNEKLAYDDVDAVIARLRGKVAAPVTVAPPTKAAAPAAAAPPAPAQVCTFVLCSSCLLI